jgi:hypothetical protein
MFTLHCVAYWGISMTTPPIKEEKDPGVRLLVGIAASIAVWGVSLVTAIRVLNRDPPGVALRAGAVALAIAGFLTWLWMASRAIVAQDEFTRRIHFIALSWAFAATGIFVVAADMLVRARFLDYVSIMNIWLFMIVAWWISLMLTTRYYR